MGKRAGIVFLGLLFITQLIIYAPHIGTGFVTDDFTWLTNIVSGGKVDYLKPFEATTGFFRPLVSIAFGVQYQLHGMNPGPYGWFNLFLHLLNILLVYLLVSWFEFSRPLALPTAALFALNAKGPVMAVAWISGRTSLLCTFFVLLAFYLYLKINAQLSQGKWDFKRLLRYAPVSITYLAALLSKETAAVVPLIIFLINVLIPKQKTDGTKARAFFKKIHTAFMETMVFIIPLMVYCFLRINSNAFTPLNAPPCYRYTAMPGILIKNLWEYITRSGMLDILILLWLTAAMIFTRGRVQFQNRIDRGILTAGSCWFLCFLLPTIALPVRSDIYVYIPQVGLHIVLLAAIIYPLHQTEAHIKKKNQYIYIILVPIGILFVAWTVFLSTRIAEAGQKGRKSFAFTRQVVDAAAAVRTGSQIFVVDMNTRHDHSPQHTVSYGFASLLELFYPHKEFNGKIISFKEIFPAVCDQETSTYFIWGNEQLFGPYSSGGVKRLITFMIGLPVVYENGNLSQAPGPKRLYRLKKRKKRLRQQQKNPGEI